MSFAVRILTISSVADVPAADSLSVNRVLGYDAVTNKNPDGSHRFAPGERVVYVPEGSKIPRALLEEHGFWDHELGQGRLSSPGKDVIRPLTLRKQLSQGLVWKLPASLAHLPDNSDVAGHLGITQYVPEVPEELLRICRPLYAAKTSYEIGRLKTYPDFLEGREVVITEKLEGECIQMTWMAGKRHKGLFGDGHIAITTKGLGQQGLVFLDNEEAREVPVVRAALGSNLVEKLEGLARMLNPDLKVQLFSEAVGPGVKKLHYGGKAPFARSFDLRVGDFWFDEWRKADAFHHGEIERVPVLWQGKFDRDVVEELRQGQTTIGGAHIREGIVIADAWEDGKRETALGDSIRPILKAHSDAFLKKFGKDD